MSISDETHANSPSLWSNEQLSGGIVDLYANRMAAVATKVETVRQEALDRVVVTQPFGRAFTAQPSFPPDPSEAASGLTGIRRKLAGTTPERARKLATS